MKKLITWAIVIVAIALLIGAVLACKENGLNVREICQEFAEYTRVGFKFLFGKVEGGINAFKTWIGK